MVLPVQYNCWDSTNEKVNDTLCSGSFTEESAVAIFRAINCPRK